MRFYNSSYLALENVEKQGNSTLVSTVIKHRIKYANSVSATLSCSVLSAENCFSFSGCTPSPSLSLSLTFFHAVSSACVVCVPVFLELSTLCVYFAYCHSTRGKGAGEGEGVTYENVAGAH